MKTTDIPLQQFHKEILERQDYGTSMGKHLLVLCFPLGVVRDFLHSCDESKMSGSCHMSWWV